MIETFLNDYFSMSLDSLMAKYGKMETPIPTKEDILSYLKNNNCLPTVLDQQPIVDTSRVFYLVGKTKGKPFQVFSFFRNMQVMESDFDEIESAVLEKFDRVLGSVRASKRG